MVSNKILVILILAVFSLLIIGCTQTTPPANFALQLNDEVSFSLQAVDDSNSLIFSQIADFDKGTNAFDAMKSILGNNFVYEMTSFGPFVKSINGKDADSTHYWALYVNDKYAEQGVASYVLNEEMNFKWKLEEMQTFASS